VSHPGWLAARSRHIGASEVAGILGVSPWASPYDIWARKTGRIPADTVSPEAEERMEWGHLLEPVILARVASQLGLDIERAPQDVHVVHPRCPVLSATPDAYYRAPDGTSGLVEVKTSLGYGARQVWEDGVPLGYQVQCQAQMACTELERVIVAVLRTGPVLETHPVERHHGTVDLVERYVPEWWARHVEGDTPPEVDAHPATVRALAALQRDALGEVVDLPEEAELWSQRLEELSRERKRIEAEETEAKNRIRAALGAASAGRLPGGGGWTWRGVERQEHVVKASSARTLRRVKSL